MKKNNKNRRLKLLLKILAIIFVFLIPFLIERFLFPNESINIYRFLFYEIIFEYFTLSYLFDLSKINNYIFKYRYLFGIIIFTLLVLFKINGSSIYLWNYYVQPEYSIDNSVLVGNPRPIRSDEWLVSSPHTLTQATKSVDFSSTNSLLGNIDNLVTFYPNLPSKDISLLSAPNFIGYLFLDTERAFSFAWFLPYFILFYSVYELFLILTNDNRKMTLIGTLLIVLSPVIQWWQNPNIVAYGCLACVLFNNFFSNKSKYKKIIFSILFGYSGFLYIMCMYPAWQIPYGYVFAVILIYLLVKNIKNASAKDLLYLIPVFSIIAIPFCLIYFQNIDVYKAVNNTVYPGARFSTGGMGNTYLLYSYMSDIFFPYFDAINPCELSQYISFYPIPTILAIYYLIKNKKKDLFLILSSIVIIFLSLWVMFEVPGFISKITLIYMSTENRCQVAIGFISVIQLIYLLSNYSLTFDSINKYKYINCFVLSIILSYIICKLGSNEINNMFSPYMSNGKFIISYLSLILFITLILINTNKTNDILALILTFYIFVCGMNISPFNQGLDVMYDKPVAKEINKIVKDNNDAVFAATDSGIVLATYIAVNGGKTINTVNYIPNMKMYKLLDENGEYDNIYNRYAHLSVDIVDDSTYFILNSDDYITLKLDKNDICKINIDYLVTQNDSNGNYVDYDKIYDEYGLKIYKTNCNR